jgi:hypothetical protein
LCEFVQTTPNGLAVAPEKPCDVSDTAVSELGSFDGGINSAIAFAQGMKDLLHRPFEVARIEGQHGGILPVLPALLCGCRKLPCRSRAKKAKWGS